MQIKILLSKNDHECINISQSSNVALSISAEICRKSIDYTRGQQSLDCHAPLMEQTWQVLTHFDSQRKHNIYEHKSFGSTLQKKGRFFDLSSIQF